MTIDIGTIVRITAGKRSGLLGRVVETGRFERDNASDVAIETEIGTVWEAPANLAVNVHQEKVRSLRHRLPLEHYKFSDGSEALVNWDDVVIQFRDARGELYEVDPTDDYSWPDMICRGVWVTHKDRLLLRDADGLVDYPASIEFAKFKLVSFLGCCRIDGLIAGIAAKLAMAGHGADTELTEADFLAVLTERLYAMETWHRIRNVA